MKISGFDGIDFGDPPRTSRNPDVVLGMDLATIEHQDDGYRVRMIDQAGHEATYRGLRGVSVRLDDTWHGVGPTDATWFRTTRIEGDLSAQLGADRILRIWDGDA